jgi:two-component system, OmpR family, sensor kinase
VKAVGVKSRLTLGHALVVSVILFATALVSDWWLDRTVHGQVDAALLALAETEVASAMDDPDEPVHLHPLRVDVDPAVRGLDRFVQLVDADRRAVVERSASLGDRSLPVPSSLIGRLMGRRTLIETVRDFGGQPLRMVALPVEVNGRLRYVLQVAIPLGPAHAFLRTARWFFLGAAAVILGGVIVTGAVLTHRALRPVDRVVVRARDIGLANLGERLPHPGTTDEIGRLVTTLNDMLARIEASLDSQRRFTGDAAHELRSPLSRLRSELEVALRRPRSAAEYEDVLRSCLDEVERLSQLTSALLVLARLDAGERRALSDQRVDLVPLVQDELRRLAPAAESRRITVVLEPPSTLVVRGVPELLHLVIANLVDNAIKFSPPGGHVTVRLARDNGEGLVVVTDTGPGIPADERPRIFERFHRGRAAGSPDAPGFGLGLAICRAVVEAHAGKIALESKPGHGASFTVRLPAVV